MVVEIILDDITDPQQLAWAKFREGDAVLKAKIIKSPKTGKVFVAIPAAFRKGLNVPIYEYDNPSLWKSKAIAILETFRKEVPEELYSQPESDSLDVF